MRRTIHLGSIILALLLAACGPAPSSPVPTAPPTPAVSPRANATPLPPSPTPTQRLAPTPRPSLHFTTGPTLTPQPTAIPTPAPTAIPIPPAVGPFVLVPPEAGRPAGAIRGLRLGPDGAVWLVTEKGLGRLQDGAWTLLQVDGGRLVGFDARGRAWWIPEDGAAILSWDGNTWTSYGAEAGWVPAPWPWAPASENVATDRRGWVWFADQTTVRTFDGERWTVSSLDQVGFTAYTETAEYDGFQLTKLVSDGEGDIWVGDCDSQGDAIVGQGARWFDGTRWGGADSPVTGAGCVMDIEVDRSGRLWLGVDQALSRYTPGQGWQQYDPPEMNPAWGRFWGYIPDIALGPLGDPWVTFMICGGASCGNGVVLFRLEGEHWAQVGEDAWDLDTAFAPDGSAWLCMKYEPSDTRGTASGVYHVVGDTPELVAEFLRCVIEVDPAGRVWVALPGTEALYVYENP